VIIDLAEEAVEYGRVARLALESAGGDALLRTAEAAPDQRAALVEPVLDGLGAWDLDVRSGPDELEAAASLCRAAGWWGAPYPVASLLAGVLVVAEGSPQAALAGLPERDWPAVSPSGDRFVATARPSPVSARARAFIVDLDLSPVDDPGPADELALGLVLPCWTLLGMLDRAISSTRAYVVERQQFGQPLSSFQGVQFQLTEAEVERVGVEELAKYALWSIESGQPGVVDDALALRLAAIEGAETVFRVTHQLHGAIGFCDETQLSWLSRHSQPLRRLPCGVSGTRDLLARRVGTHGLAGLFDALAPS
jgi:hypothetical protein